MVSANIQSAQEKQKEHHERLYSSETVRFEIRMNVLIKSSKRINRMGDKLDPYWCGPYEVLATGKKMYFRIEMHKIRQGTEKKN